MGQFRKTELTDLGMALMMKVQSGAELQFLKLLLGDGDPQTADITSLDHYMAEFTAVGQPVIDNGFAILKFNLSNTPAGFWWKEFIVTAEDPDLGEIAYAYSYVGDEQGFDSSKANWIPPSGSATIWTQQFSVFMRIDNATNVSAYVSDHAYLTHDDLDDHNNNATAHNSLINGLQPAIDGKVAKAGDAMTGFLTLPANPTANLHAAPKQYVDDKTECYYLHADYALSNVGTATTPFSTSTISVVNLTYSSSTGTINIPKRGIYYIKCVNNATGNQTYLITSTNAYFRINNDPSLDVPLQKEITDSTNQKATFSYESMIKIDDEGPLRLAFSNPISFGESGSYIKIVGISYW